MKAYVAVLLKEKNRRLLRRIDRKQVVGYRGLFVACMRTKVYKNHSLATNVMFL